MKIPENNHVSRSHSFVDRFLQVKEGLSDYLPEAPGDGSNDHTVLLLGALNNQSIDLLILIFAMPFMDARSQFPDVEDGFLINNAPVMAALIPHQFPADIISELVAGFHHNATKLCSLRKVVPAMGGVEFPPFGAYEIINDQLSKLSLMVDSVKGRMGVQLSNDHLFFSVGMPTLNGLTNEINWMQKETMILQHAAAFRDKHQLHHDLLELKRGLSEIYTQRSLFFYDRLLATLNIILDAQSIASDGEQKQPVGHTNDEIHFRWLCEQRLQYLKNRYESVSLAGFNHLVRIFNGWYSPIEPALPNNFQSVTYQMGILTSNEQHFLVNPYCEAGPFGDRRETNHLLRYSSLYQL